MTKAEREKQRQREVIVSRSKLILIGVCLIAIPITFWVNHGDVGSLNQRVTKVESPCLRYGPKSPQCKEAFEAAVATITHPEACAIERKAGTLKAIRELASVLHISFKEPCAGARLAQERQRGNEREATSHRRASKAAPGAANPGGEAQAPPHPGTAQPPASPHPAGPPAHQPPNSGNEGGGGPQHEPPGAVPQPPAAEAVRPEGREPTKDNPGLLPSTLENAGEAVGGVVGKGEGTVEQAGCSVRDLLKPCP